MGLRALSAVAGGVLASTLALTARAEPRASGWFIDRAGEQRSFPLEYRTLFVPRESHPLRAAAEMGVLIALGTAYYFSDPLANEKNYDNPRLLDKLDGSAWCFDNNLTSTNFILHPLAGASFYGFSRINGLGVAPAFGYAVLSSLVWESALEWREQSSVNDLIVTPFAGAALGEFLFRLGEYVNSEAGGQFGNQLARYSIGLPRAIHEAPPRSTLPTDDLGFSSGYWHSFTLSSSFGAFSSEDLNTLTLGGLGVDARLVALPGYRQLGRFATYFDQGNFTDASLRVLYGHGGVSEVDLRADAIFYGHYSQTITDGGGLGRVFGLRGGMRYYDSFRRPHRDTFASAELPGPAARFWVQQSSFSAELAATVHFDFAGIRPAAYTAYKARYGDLGVKSVLSKHGYAYHGCASGSLDVRFGYGPFRTGAEGRMSACRSLEGLDRFTRRIPDEAHGRDRSTELRVWARFPRGEPVQLGVELQQRWRSGSMADVRSAFQERWLSGALTYEF